MKPKGWEPHIVGDKVVNLLFNDCGDYGVLTFLDLSGNVVAEQHLQAAPEEIGQPYKNADEIIIGDA